MRTKLFIIGLFAAVLLQGCHQSVELTDSKDVDQKKIFQLYIVNYDAESGEMSATAEFHVDHRSGTQLRLTEPSKVTAAKKEMSLNDDGKYECKLKQHQQVLHFEYTNNDNEKFKNSVITNTIKFNQRNIRLKKNQTTRIAIKAEPFEESETVSCMLTNNEETVEIDIDFGTGRLTVTPDMLESLQPGTYTARLVRKNYGYQLDALDRGGEWESQYVSSSQKITIE